MDSNMCSVCVTCCPSHEPCSVRALLGGEGRGMTTGQNEHSDILQNWIDEQSLQIHSAQRLSAVVVDLNDTHV